MMSPWWHWLKDSSKVCLQSLVGSDPSIVSQIVAVFWSVLLSQSVRSPFVGFFSFMDKSFVIKAPLVVDIC